jgi:hypothetical protein
MKSPDVNETLQSEGDDGVRRRNDGAKPYNGGGDEARGDPPPRPKALPFKTFDEITAAVITKPWIIKNVLARGETSSWFGPPGATKSSLWTDIAVHVAGQETWRGYRIKANTGVAFIAMERAHLVERRLYAYRLRDGLSSLPIAVIGKTIDFMSRNCVDILIDTIKSAEDRFGREMGVAVLDTYGKGIAAGGGDEDKARDQNIVLANMRRVMERIDIHFATIGHTGKDESKGERGSNAKRADMDLQVQITGEGIRTATIIKANDGPGGPLTAYQMSPVNLGVDEDGEPIQTFIVSKEILKASEAPREKLTANQKLALEALIEVSLSTGVTAPGHLQLPSSVKVVFADAWKVELDHRDLLGGKNPRSRYSELRNSLAAKKLIGYRDDLVWAAHR